MENDGASSWLLLGYSLPTEPSRYRVSVWRRLRKLGAVHLNEGFWVLPNSPSMRSELDGVIREIRSYNGTPSAFTSSDFDPQQNERLRAKFLEARDEEYREVQGQYDKFVVHVDHARSTHRFTFAEVEELEEEISKLERWLNEVSERDTFGSPQQEATAASLREGRELLQRFTEDTYAESQDSKPADAVDTV